MLCGGLGAIPGELVRAVAGFGPDETRRMVDTYMESHVDADAVEDRFRQQREYRRVRRYRVPADAGKPELSGLGIEGPDAEIERLLAEITAMVDSLYIEDGGREQPADSHRSVDQRRFDSVIELFGFGLRPIGTKNAVGRVVLPLLLRSTQQIFPGLMKRLN